MNDSRISLNTHALEIISGGHGEIGVAYHSSDGEREASPTLFWLDEESLYLRYNWANWYVVSHEKTNNVKALCRRANALLYIYEDGDVRSVPMKVVHVSDVPEEIFSADVVSNSEDNDNGSFILEEHILRKQLAEMGANFITGAKFERTRVNFYEYRGTLLVVTFFLKFGEFTANEDPVVKDEPYWINEITAELSPYYIAEKIVDAIIPAIDDKILIRSLICLNPDAVIVNESAYLTENYDPETAFIYPIAKEGSLIKTLDYELDDISGETREDIIELSDKLVAALKKQEANHDE